MSVVAGSVQKTSRPRGIMNVMSSLDDNCRVSRDVVFRELAGEGVVLDLKGGTYFGLDEVGTRIWQLIEERGRLRDVFDALLAEFDVQPATLEHDLLSLVDELTARGLVSIDAS
jgi:hypothetical protein